MVGFFHPFSTRESKDDKASLAMRLMAVLNVFGSEFHPGTIKKTLSLHLHGSLMLLRVPLFQRNVAVMGCYSYCKWCDLLGNVGQSRRGFWRLGLWPWTWQSMGTNVGRRAPWRCSLGGLCWWVRELLPSELTGAFSSSCFHSRTEYTETIKCHKNVDGQVWRDVSVEHGLFHRLNYFGIQ